MEVNDVDDLGAESLQGAIDAPIDAGPGPVRDTGDSVAELGGENELGPPALERAAQALLGSAVAPRSVDEGDPELGRRSEQSVHVGVARLRATDPPCAETEDRDGQTGVAERTAENFGAHEATMPDRAAARAAQAWR